MQVLQGATEEKEGSSDRSLTCSVNDAEKLLPVVIPAFRYSTGQMGIQLAKQPTLIDSESDRAKGKTIVDGGLVVLNRGHHRADYAGTVDIRAGPAADANERSPSSAYNRVPASFRKAHAPTAKLCHSVLLWLLAYTDTHCLAGIRPSQQLPTH